jgi:DNA polymerase-3 subunit beta
MKFEIDRTIFSEALARVAQAGVMSNSRILPILSNVLISGKTGSGLDFLTSTLDIYVQSTVQGAHVKVTDSGSLTLPLRRLLELIKNCGASTIQFSHKDGKATIKSGSSRFTLYSLAADEFPPVPELLGHVSNVKTGAEAFLHAIDRTLYAASTDESRYVLNGMLLQAGEASLTAVATDGRRLAKTRVEHLGAESEPLASGSQTILPGNAARELRRHLIVAQKEGGVGAEENPVVIQLSNDHAAIHLPATDSRMWCKFIEGNYPNWQQVVPGTPTFHWTVDREQLTSAVRRISLMSTNDNIKFEFEERETTISAVSPEIGDASEVINGHLKNVGDGKKKTMQVAVNPKFLLEGLAAYHSDELTFKLIDEMSPVVMDSDDLLYILMPMRCQ